jgi:hypothetical protein
MKVGLYDIVVSATILLDTAMSASTSRPLTPACMKDPGGSPIDRLLGRPLDILPFLRIAIPLAGALRKVHERGLVHKDIKPANILVDAASGAKRLRQEVEGSRLHGSDRCRDIAGTCATSRSLFPRRAR